MKKYSIVSIVLICFIFLSGCSSFLIQKDQLIEIDNDQIDGSSEGITANVQINTYEDLFKGTLLAYDPEHDLAVFTNTFTSQDGTTSELSVYEDGFLSQLFTSAGTYSEAKIDLQTDDIYFKEKNIENNTSAIFMTTKDGENVVRLTDDIYEKYVAWNLTEEGFLIYVTDENHVVMGNKDEQVDIYTLPTSYTVKKIAYNSKENFILLLASTSQTSNVLYRQNFDEEFSLTAIDINVSDFVMSTDKEITAYIKTASSKQDQLYIYDHNALLRKYVCTNYIEKLSFSPKGNYIAFATKTTEDIPTQSIWLVKYNHDIPVQLTANTKLSGGIYWTEDESGILFTTNVTTANQTDTAPNFMTYLLKFTFEY